MAVNLIFTRNFATNPKAVLKHFCKYLLLFFTVPLLAQNISVEGDTYSPQELVEDILINSGCIENVEVNGVIGGNFSDGDKSFGYFENNNGPFPFSNGLVMSTGRLTHVPGPNDNLSDDDAPGWGGDADLENFLYIPSGGTTNATVIEFDFTPNADNIKFRYIFASEEYRENNSTTCQYSDAFAFLIKPVGGQYENIAVIPGTTIPVKVTTVHPEIPGACPAENEEYFGGFNGSDAPINFNGQTKILTAKATVAAGETYHIKLVIADEQNYRYDSAVFLEGDSFEIGANLGEDISGLCEGETVQLEPQGNGMTPSNYSWYKVNPDGSETLLIQGPDENTYEVDQAGTYKVVLDYGNGCSAEDSIVVSYVTFDDLQALNINSCETDGQGRLIFDLLTFSNLITQGNQAYFIDGFYLNSADAESGTDPIPDPHDFAAEPGQEIYARILTDRGCSTSVKITLREPDENTEPVYLVECSPADSGNLNFDLNEAIADIQDQLGENVGNIAFFETFEEAVQNENPLDHEYAIEVSELPHSVYAGIHTNSGCGGIFEIVLMAAPHPEFDPDYRPPSLCADAENAIELHSGVTGSESDYSFMWNNGETGSTLTVTAPGTYEVSVSLTSEVHGKTITCTATNSLEVKLSEKPDVDYVLLGKPGDYKVEIIASGDGNYQYALDNGDFQTDSVFSVETGKHVFYVKDMQGCGTVKRTFYAVGFMKFFTPNNDGYNDYWRLSGVNPRHPQVKRVLIFNRYGKLLRTLDPFGEWDGTYNGKPVYENDYWFMIDFKDGSTYTDHFTLVR